MLLRVQCFVFAPKPCAAVAVSERMDGFELIVCHSHPYERVQMVSLRTDWLGNRLPACFNPASAERASIQAFSSGLVSSSVAGGSSADAGLNLLAVPDPQGHVLRIHN
jgi:hypothetical protein